jgi:hypothetical protein
MSSPYGIRLSEGAAGVSFCSQEFLVTFFDKKVTRESNDYLINR